MVGPAPWLARWCVCANQLSGARLTLQGEGGAPGTRPFNSPSPRERVAQPVGSREPADRGLALRPAGSYTPAVRTGARVGARVPLLPLPRALISLPFSHEMEQEFFPALSQPLSRFSPESVPWFVVCENISCKVGAARKPSHLFFWWGGRHAGVMGAPQTLGKKGEWGQRLTYLCGCSRLG